VGTCNPEFELYSYDVRGDLSQPLEVFSLNEWPRCLLAVDYATKCIYGEEQLRNYGESDILFVG